MDTHQTKEFRLCCTNRSRAFCPANKDHSIVDIQSLDSVDSDDHSSLIRPWIGLTWCIHHRQCLSEIQGNENKLTDQ